MKHDLAAEFFRNFVDGFVLYGCGRFGTAMLGYLVTRGRAPLAICDGNQEIQGDNIAGFPVLSPAEAGETYGQIAPFVVAIQGFYSSPEKQNALKRQLEKHGCSTVVFLPDALFYQIDCEESLPEQGLSIIHGAFFLSRQAFGERTTIDQPESSKNTVFISGDSVACSYGLPDGKTLASHLQNLCNRNGAGLIVRNFGGPNPFFGNILLKVLSLDIAAGDVVIIITAAPMHVCDDESTRSMVKGYIAMQRHCREKGGYFLAVNTPSVYTLDFDSLDDTERAMSGSNTQTSRVVGEFGRRHAAAVKNALNLAGCPFLDLREEIQRLHDGGTPIFIDKQHLTAQANQWCAEYLFKNAIQERNALTSTRLEPLYADAMRSMAIMLSRHYQGKKHKELHNWLDRIHRPPLPRDATIGCVVMNCNPFTYGHRHLITTAAAEVDYLYVFVVEEDTSEIAFADRLRLVREGVQEMGNTVAVYPSGKFVLSTLTFAEYFTKETILDADTIDPSYDIAFFGGVIAPRLGITTRFVGEEPLCRVTARYNEMMFSMLPPMGIAVRQIPRLSANNGAPISASQVRRLWRAKEWATLTRLVPPATHEFLTRRSAEMDDRQAGSDDRDIRR